jgi:hypothetical protein
LIWSIWAAVGGEPVTATGCTLLDASTSCVLPTATRNGLSLKLAGLVKNIADRSYRPGATRNSTGSPYKA